MRSSHGALMPKIKTHVTNNNYICEKGECMTEQNKGTKKETKSVELNEG